MLNAEKDVISKRSSCGWEDTEKHVTLVPSLWGAPPIGQLALFLGVLLVMRSRVSAPEVPQVPQSGFDDSVSASELCELALDELNTTPGEWAKAAELCGVPAECHKLFLK